MTYIPGAGGAGSGNVSSSTDVILNGPTVKDVLGYDDGAKKWSNKSIANFVVATTGTTRLAHAGACLFTGSDPGGNAQPGDMWLNPATNAGGSTLVYDQQFTGVNGSVWDGFDSLNMLGRTGGVADQQNGDGRIRLNSSGDYSNNVTVTKTMQPILDGTFSGAFRVPSSAPDIAVTVYVRGSGGQPNYQSTPATSYNLAVHPAASRVHFRKQLNEQAPTIMGEDLAFSMPANAVVRWKLQAINGSIKAKIWKDAETEPEWKWEYTDPAPLPQGIDGVGVRGEPAYNSGDVLFVYLSRATTAAMPVLVKKRNASGGWDAYQLASRSAEGQWR